ncbi:MAG: hypothetical protein JNL64_15110 [Blastocatellia bacterium]|nr:hypothetical protein [Blastocatellia bacterium]
MYIFESRYWIDTDGLLVKQSDSQRNTTPDNITQQNATTYEFNPKDLKIEAPIK